MRRLILRDTSLLSLIHIYTDPRVRAILAQKGYLLYHVRQGYAGCSSISIPYADGKILVLSSDPGVISTIDGLHLPELCTEYFTQTEEIVLSGYDHGLIGGCCGFDAELGLLVYCLLYTSRCV